MEIQITRKENMCIIQPVGRMDALSAPEFDVVSVKVMEENVGTQIVILMDKLDYISSAGLRSMLVFAKTLKANKKTLTFVCLQPAVLEVFTISGFTSIFQIFENLEQIQEL